jgi:hypothetical protein
LFAAAKAGPGILLVVAALPAQESMDETRTWTGDLRLDQQGEQIAG